MRKVSVRNFTPIVVFLNANDFSSFRLHMA
jgi:hypothetical protein